jgi:hypothetical protein
MDTVRRWTTIDDLEDILNGAGLGLEISGVTASVTGVGTIPASGLVLGGVVCQTVAAIMDALNGYVDVPVGEQFELSKQEKVVDTFELHKQIYE